MDNIGELISKCGSDNNALEQLYLMFKGQVFAIAYSVLRDKNFAEDVVIETFVRLRKKSNAYEEKGYAKCYILKMARLISLEIYKQNKRAIRINEEMLVAKPGENIDDKIVLQCALKTLNAKQREVINYHFYFDLTFSEIAVVLNVKESTIKWRYYQAIKQLQKIDLK